MKGLERIKAGHTLMDIASAVQDHVEAHGYAVVEDYTGHGVGRNLHEEPSVFNYRTRDLPNVTLSARHDSGGGAHPQCRQQVLPHPSGPVDGGHHRWQPVGPVGTHHRGDQ